MRSQGAAYVGPFSHTTNGRIPYVIPDAWDWYNNKICLLDLNPDPLTYDNNRHRANTRLDYSEVVKEEGGY